MTAHPYITGIDPCGYIAVQKRSRWPDFWGGNQFSDRERRIRMKKNKPRIMDVYDEHREQIRRGTARADRKAKIIFTVKWLSIGFVVGLVLTMLTSCGISDPSMSASREETTVTESVQEPVAATIPVLATQEPETVPVSSGEPAAATVPVQAAQETGSQTVTVPEGAPAAAETHEAPEAVWHTSTKEHDITVNSILTYEDGAIWNFADCTAVGAGIESDIAVPTEADYGFIVNIVDSNTVDITVYNNCTESVVPVKVTAGLSSGELETTDSYDAYTITGYANCPDGFGTVSIKFSNGRTLIAGVFKENDRLYAVNINTNKSIATNAVDRRLALAELMEEAGITEDDCVSTDPIYYPIVPMNKGEVTDTAYWVTKSSELVEDDWTDAHKIMTFYNYVIDNFAYDDWAVAQGTKNRCFEYSDFSGKYYISNTKVGVCEDFSQVIAIMCRAQGIPALVFHNQKHAVTVAYIKEYGRWFLIDSTADIENDAYQEDYTVWVKTNKTRYKNFGYTAATNFSGIAIGNDADMEKFSIPMFQ